MAAQPEHEALVAQFFARCQQNDPDLYREVCERHAVLTPSQMNHRARREIAGSQLNDMDARRQFEELLYSDSGGGDA